MLGDCTSIDAAGAREPHAMSASRENWSVPTPDRVDEAQPLRAQKSPRDCLGGAGSSVLKHLTSPKARYAWLSSSVRI